MEQILYFRPLAGSLLQTSILKNHRQECDIFLLIPFLDKMFLKYKSKGIDNAKA